MAELERVMELLAAGQMLPPEYRDHPLRGEWADCRDCHIRGDWVLIYRIGKTPEGEELIFIRTGTHSELFD